MPRKKTTVKKSKPKPFLKEAIEQAEKNIKAQMVALSDAELIKYRKQELSRKEIARERRRAKVRKAKIKAFTAKFLFPKRGNEVDKKTTLRSFFDNRAAENKWIWHNNAYYLEIIKDVKIEFGMFNLIDGVSRGIGMNTSHKVITSVSLFDKDFRAAEALHINDSNNFLGAVEKPGVMMIYYLPADRKDDEVPTRMLVNFQYTSFVSFDQKAFEPFREYEQFI